MDVPNILEILRNRFVELYLYKGIIQVATDQEIKRISEYLDKCDDSSGHTSSYMSLHNMLFRDLKTGSWVRYGFSRSTAEHHLSMIYKNKNKQYGWLLVEAYEEFECFLEGIYAHVGKTNPNAWHMEEFGRIKMSDLNHKSFEWFRDAVRQKYKFNSRGLLNRIREICPELRGLEEHNALQINLRVAIALTGELRNHIVHSRGIVDDLDEFIKCVLRPCGLWNNGNPRPELTEFIRRHFRATQQDITISLSEIQITPPESPLREFYDVWSELLEYLIAYAHAIAACVDPATIHSDR